LSCGLRRGNLHHVACWIRSASLGDIFHVIGRFLSGLTRCERSGQNMRIISVILIMWYQITGLITASIFCKLFDLQIIRIQAVFRSASLFVGVEIDLVADWISDCLFIKSFQIGEDLLG
jgi:hypothetical protein